MTSVSWNHNCHEGPLDHEQLLNYSRKLGFMNGVKLAINGSSEMLESVW